MRRREFLIVSSVGAAFASVARAAPAGAFAAWPGGTVRGAAEAPHGAGAGTEAVFADVHAVVYEPRYAISRDFARQHEMRGVPVFRSDQCMVRLWRGPLVGRPEPGGAVTHSGPRRAAHRLPAAPSAHIDGSLRIAGAVRSPDALRIAGVTLYSDFAIARDCARDMGVRVLREEWLSDAPAALVTWLIGSS
jgi:hypothetical protein